ncbi:MAG: HAMP domain-containing histidine kinase, partial [Planctomycetota bacterium]|nr:HAMP domain-containing histidine kinase [Planctomycetota bacterium]
FARQDAGLKQYVLAEEDVADTVSEALDLFRHSARVQGFDLYVELPPVGALPPVDLDREAIARAVLNLLSNAVKYSGDNRWVRVSVQREGRETIAVAVEDKGLGIDEEDVPHIFDRFYRAGDVLTRGVSGTGLGLALVDQIVQAHEGKVRVESEKGVGSIFTVLLPIVPDYRDQWPPPPLPGQESSDAGTTSGVEVPDEDLVRDEAEDTEVDDTEAGGAELEDAGVEDVEAEEAEVAGAEADDAEVADAGVERAEVDGAEVDDADARGADARGAEDDGAEDGGDVSARDARTPTEPGAPSPAPGAGRARGTGPAPSDVKPIGQLRPVARRARAAAGGPSTSRRRGGTMGVARGERGRPGWTR